MTIKDKEIQVDSYSIIRGTSTLTSEEMNHFGSLIVVTGPSGVGKGTVTRGVIDKIDNLYKSVSVTTRPKREGEEEGVDYFFRSEEEFETMRAQGEFLESAEFANYYYGTPESWVEEQIRKGSDVILEIEVQGAMQVIVQPLKYRIPIIRMDQQAQFCGCESPQFLARVTGELEFNIVGIDKASIRIVDGDGIRIVIGEKAIGLA